MMSRDRKAEPGAHLVPAQPGWEVVTIDESDRLFRLPVIAWFVDLRTTVDDDAYAVVSAIAPTGIIDDIAHALQFGDRPPFVTIDGVFDDEAALLSWFRDQDRLNRARRAWEGSGARSPAGATTLAAGLK